MSDGFLAPPGALSPPGELGPSAPPDGAPSWAPPTSADSAPASSVELTTGPRRWLWVHTAHPNPLTVRETEPVRRTTTTVFAPARRLAPPPAGVEIVGGSSVMLDGVVALDRLASGHGCLTVTIEPEGVDCDLVALTDDADVAARGHGLVIDLVPGLRRVLIATGTRTSGPLPAMSVVLTNGDTRVECRLPGGHSYGVWPRLSLVPVDGFVVVIDERDEASGPLDAVASAYGFDPRDVVVAGG